jgi:molybdate transport system substrate-binding protein
MQHILKIARPVYRLLLATGLALAAASAWAADIHVMTSGGFTAAYNRLVPEFEHATGHKVITAYGASMGNAPDAIPSRLARKEPVDIVILAAPALEDLVRQGQVAAGSRVDLVRSLVGMAVRAGAPKPDISSVDAFKRALLDAPSIAYSASASGTYISTEMFQKLGIADQVMGKSRRILSERVGAVVARGEAELGFQQVSELLPVPGIDFVGTIPAEVQLVTVFSAGIASAAREPDAARALVRYFTTPAAAPTIRQTGLEPITQQP